MNESHKQINNQSTWLVDSVPVPRAGVLGGPQLCRCLRPGTLPPGHYQFQGGRGQASLVMYERCVWALLPLVTTPPSIKRSSSHLRVPISFVSSNLPLCPDASPLEAIAWGREAGSLPEPCLLLYLEATASGSQDSFILALGKEGGKQLKASGRCLDPCLGYPYVF